MKINIARKGRKSNYKGKILYPDEGKDTRGGGCFFYNENNINVENQVFMFNRASKDGGGIFFYNCKTIHIEKCTFICNFAKWGGAIYFERCENIELCNNKFLLNFALRDGGAISFSHCNKINIKQNNLFLGNKAIRSCNNMEFHECT